MEPTFKQFYTEQEEYEPQYRFKYFRGVSEEDIDSVRKTGHLLPSQDSILDDYEVLENVFGPDESDIKLGLKDLKASFGKELYAIALKKGANLTKDFYNAKGYGEFVVAVTIDPPYYVQDLSEDYAIVADVTKAKVEAIYDVKESTWKIKPSAK
jgi:hypothetical protein